MRYLIFSFLFVLTLFSSCSDAADVLHKMPIPVDTLQVINEFFEKDSQKHLDTLKVVYKLGNEEYIRGVVIRRANVIVPPSYINDSVSKVLMDILTYTGYGSTIDKDVLYNLKTFTCQRDSMTLNNLLKELNKQTRNINFWRSDVNKMVYADIKDVTGREDTIRLKGDNANNHVIEAPVGSRIQLTFFDNSKVCLNAGTRLLINGSFSKNRYLSVDGEVSVDLKTNKDSILIETKHGHKFILKQGNLTINTFADSANYSATLMHGSASLYDRNGREQIALSGNRCITFGEPHVLIERKKADPEIANSWCDGFLAHDQTLNIKSYFDAFGRWYDVTIKMPKRPLTFGWEGRFPLESSCKNVLRIFNANDIWFDIKLDEYGKIQLVIL